MNQDNHLALSHIFSAVLVSILAVACTISQTPVPDDRSTKRNQFPNWKTNFEKSAVSLDEFMSGGPPKDGIPAIDKPNFVRIEDAREWLQKNEPVISLTINGESRAYPLQILMWHEIANDEIQGQPVSVTFCPLCYTAVVFDRRLNGKVLDFGVSGLLRHSDMVMYDRQTETWWQQISGEGLVGDLTGTVLKQFPAQIVSFEQFLKAFPKGTVLSRETGYRRDYGRNPYTGYDSVDNKPFLFKGKTDDRLKPMEKVVAIDLNGRAKAYPHALTSKQRVVHDRIGETDLVIFHADGAASAMDSSRIADSKEIGSTGVFKPFAIGRKLTFRYDKGEFVDNETGSRWNIFGKAIGGELRDSQLEQITHGDVFAFAWLVFKPDTEIYKGKAAP